MWFRSWFDVLGIGTQSRRSRPSPRSGDRRRRQTRRLFMEGLEQRQMLTFLPALDFPVGAAPQAVVTGDFNNDGHLDVAAANAVPGTVSVLLGDGAGGFVAAIESGVGAVFHQSGGHLQAISLTVADFNNDGHLDLAMASYFQNYETGEFYGAVGVNMSNGDGTFRAATHPFNNGLVLSVAAGDFNNDGNSDLAVNFLAPGFSFGEFYGQHEVLLGNGQGGFTAAGMSGYAHGEALLSPAVGDLNRDGILDVVLVQAGGQGGDVLLGSGAGGPTFLYLRSNYYTTNQNAQTVAIGDFTGDGFPDLVVAGDAMYVDDPSGVDILTGRGGTFDSPISHSANGYHHTGVAVADFNGDGLLDAVTSDADTGTVSELLGNGNGTLSYAGAFAVGSSHMAVVVGDFNGDCRTDVATANAGSNTVSVLLNDGDWTPPPPPPPALRIGDRTVTEGNTGTIAATFTVTLSAASTETITVAYATANGSASVGNDYQVATGTLAIPAGQTTGTITVLVSGDRLAEATETFFVNLSSPTNAVINDGQGEGTILDNEPRISISDLSMKEGKRNQTTLFTFTVTLSAAYDQPVTMSYRTVNGTAKTSDSDYIAKTGTLTFAPGQTTKTITIEVKGDSKKEANETFYVDLFSNSGNSQFTKNRGLGSILNDD
ncbi:MAG: VCBS repeat-containing protein [Planctomycetaceae bacterium]|nr:VCBS repeat-containing protein [Planctomycetaceae bacterium]